MSPRKRRRAWGNVPGRAANLAGPRRALSLDEQLEIQRLVKEARVERRLMKTAAELAIRYGVSNRTIFRYAQTVAVPPGLEYLAMRVKEWAAERGIVLTFDDISTLLYVIQRHRDVRSEASPSHP